MDASLIVAIVFIVAALAVGIFLVTRFFLTKRGSTSVYDSPGLSGLPEEGGEVSYSSPQVAQPVETATSTEEDVGTLHEEAIVEEQPVATTTTAASFCPNCGEELDETATKFCPYCGATL